MLTLATASGSPLRYNPYGVPDVVLIAHAESMSAPRNVVFCLPRNNFVEFSRSQTETSTLCPFFWTLSGLNEFLNGYVAWNGQGHCTGLKTGFGGVSIFSCSGRLETML